VEGALLADRIDRLAGLTIANGYGDGEPVLYARIPFRAVAAGMTVFETAPSTSGLALTPPVGRLTVTSTEFSGDAVTIVDLGGGGETEVVYNLVKGWNLVGIPLHVGAARGLIERNGLQFYEWGGETYRRAAGVQAGMAYWVYSDQARQLVVTGFAAEPGGLKLRRGWNLIAPLTASPPEMPAGVLCMYAWKADEERFVRPDLAVQRGATVNLQPGEGLWVCCAEDDVIIWPADAVEPRR